MAQSTSSAAIPPIPAHDDRLSHSTRSNSLISTASSGGASLRRRSRTRTRTLTSAQRGKSQGQQPENASDARGRDRGVVPRVPKLEDAGVHSIQGTAFLRLFFLVIHNARLLFAEFGYLCALLTFQGIRGRGRRLLGLKMVLRVLHRRPLLLRGQSDIGQIRPVSLVVPWRHLGVGK